MLSSLIHLPVSLLAQAPPTGAGLEGETDLKDLPPEVGPTFWMPRQSSTVAGEIDWIFNFITWVSIVSFILVVGLMFWYMWKYRQRGREVHARGPTHNTPLEVTWSILPLIIVIYMFYIGFVGYVNLATPPQNAYEIQVTGQKWSWTFQYPNGVITSNTEPDALVVPANRPVKLILGSTDVLHSFFIPDFRVKQDAVPGRYTYLWFEALRPNASLRYDEEGAIRWDDDQDYHIFHCTEYCGTGHSDMNGKVRVLNDDDFEAWLVEKANWIDRIPPEQLYWKAGPQLYAQCKQCHSLDGATIIGPSWGPREGYEGETIWERTVNGETRFDNGQRLADLMGPGNEYGTPEDYLRDSILVPGSHLVEGFGNVMPTFKGQFGEQKLQAIIGFMKHLDEFDENAVWQLEPPEEPAEPEPES